MTPVNRQAPFRVLALLLSTLCASTDVLADAGFNCHRVPPLTDSPVENDVAAEEAFCTIDVTAPSVAMCAKTWSTSPAALIYDLEGTSWEEKSAEFESRVCALGGRARDKARAELAIFKNSLNGSDTSGTFAPASLLYYHFSRLLQTRIQVPVAVMAEFPLQAYHQRVVVPGLQDTGSGRLKMLHAGWVEMDVALTDPANYSHRRELLTADNERLWGVFLLQDGRRYGPEVNGTRASGWGDGQNRDFQQTAPFLALRADLPLVEAISKGLDRAKEDPRMASSLVKNVSASQVAWWMNEITELVVLDTILRQQDRIGNIDYHSRWLWLEQGSLRSSSSRPENTQAIKMRLSLLNDNDAGVRSGYANYARRTGMLNGWRHMDAGLYQRVQSMAVDFGESGSLATAIRRNYRLSRREAEGIIERGIEVAQQLRDACEGGMLRFDLSVSGVMNPAEAIEATVDCG